MGDAKKLISLVLGLAAALLACDRETERRQAPPEDVVRLVEPYRDAARSLARDAASRCFELVRLDSWPQSDPRARSPAAGSSLASDPKVLQVKASCYAEGSDHGVMLRPLHLSGPDVGGDGAAYALDDAPKGASDRVIVPADGEEDVTLVVGENVEVEGRRVAVELTLALRR